MFSRVFVKYFGNTSHSRFSRTRNWSKVGNGEKIGSHDPPSWRYDLVTRHPRPLTSPQRVYQRSLCPPFLFHVSMYESTPRWFLVDARESTRGQTRSHNMFSESLSIKTNTFSLTRRILVEENGRFVMRNPIQSKNLIIYTRI